jgi:hypothetical protein
MTRSRSFCVYCGTVIWAGSTACQRHSHLLALEPGVDANLPDPLESLPTMAASLSDRCRACDGSGMEYPGLECPLCGGSGLAAHLREDTSSREGKAV